MTTKDWTNALVKENVERGMEKLFYEMWKDKYYKRFSMHCSMVDLLQARGVKDTEINAIDETFKRHTELVARCMFLLGLERGLNGEWDLWSIVKDNADRMNPFPYDLDLLYGIDSIPFVQSCSVALDEQIKEQHKREVVEDRADF